MRVRTPTPHIPSPDGDHIHGVGLETIQAVGVGIKSSRRGDLASCGVFWDSRCGDIGYGL